MKKILIVDDSLETIDLTERALESGGFRTFAAQDGEHGLRLARELLPDLIICDINMPGLNGYEVLAELRRDASTAAIPIIFLTGFAEREQVRRGMELGADDYVTKPFSVSELRASVSTRLERQSLLRQQSDKKLHELQSNISLALPHELRTPLTSIVCLAAVLKDDSETMSRQEIHETADILHDSADRLQRLVENFLLFAQIELLAADPVRAAAWRAKASVPAREILTSLAGQKAQCLRRTGDLFMEIEAVNAPVSAQHLQKIADELLGNAFKFSQPGTPITFAAQVMENEFHLLVADHGRGMTPEEIAKVGPHMQFQRVCFEQQGMGLGLIIAKRLTELCGGEFRIRSQPGKGTTVRVIFPLAAP